MTNHKISFQAKESEFRPPSLIVNRHFLTCENLILIIAQNKMPGKEVTMDEVAKHKSDKDCWVVIQGQAYDVTNFLSEHRTL